MVAADDRAAPIPHLDPDRPGPRCRGRRRRREITDYQWLRPADALAARDAGDLDLLSPTWVTLWTLAAQPSVAAALTAAAAATPELFETRIARVAGGVLALWHGDAGYADGDASKTGGGTGSGWSTPAGATSARWRSWPSCAWLTRLVDAGQALPTSMSVRDYRVVARSWRKFVRPTIDVVLPLFVTLFLLAALSDEAQHESVGCAEVRRHPGGGDPRRRPRVAAVPTSAGHRRRVGGRLGVPPRRTGTRGSVHRPHRDLFAGRRQATDRLGTSAGGVGGPARRPTFAPPPQRTLTSPWPWRSLPGRWGRWLETVGWRSNRRPDGRSPRNGPGSLGRCTTSSPTASR